ncbi:MAG TPA: hypothetical protein VFZ72_03790 [Jiangellaceae bacterium]
MDEIQMEPDLVTEPRLVGVLQELMNREPLFHRRELVNSRESFERETAEDFWETGASGRRYSREFVWATLRQRYEISNVDEYKTERWQTRDSHLREIAPSTYLLTYTLRGPDDRLTRRLTVWQGSTRDGWKVLYHQGTVAA